MKAIEKIIRVGCCGFPIRKREYYKKFNCVEIQSTFYQLPAKTDTVKKWKENAPRDFVFSVKAWQLITHDSSSPTYKRLKIKISPSKKKKYGFFKDTKEVYEAWEKTKGIAKVLEAKIILFQCPPSFKPESKNIENFKRFFKKIKTKKFLYVWEPRGNWPPYLIKELCQELNLIHCVDPFKKKSVYGEINYFRLHGKPGYNLRYKYTDEDLKELKKKCYKKINYCMFNNLSMLEDAEKFKKLV